jgi:FixJ family two-component response regulator
MHQGSTLFAAVRHSTPTSADLRPIAPSTPNVFIADSDTSTREAFAAVAQAMGWRAIELPSMKALLLEPEDTVPSCLVLDVSDPWFEGIPFYERLAAERSATPIVCVTGVPDILMTVSVMKAGAIDVLPKPVPLDRLVDAVRHGLARSEAKLQEKIASRSLRERYAVLSPRERQVMMLVASGLLNKQAGGELGISEITVKAHRGRVMRKMNARSLADLVKMVDRLKLAGMDAPC